MNKLPDRIRIKDIARLANVSVGTVDRVIHDRPGVSQESRKRVEEILNQLDYHPNIYASALASNKKYLFICLLPQHRKGEYWTAIEDGINEAIDAYSDFHISTKIFYYDPYNFNSFLTQAENILQENPDGIMLAPTAPAITKKITDELNSLSIPYIYIDSNISSNPPLAFFGQHSRQSGYFAARMLMLTAENKEQIALFRKINEGIVGSNQQENREIGFRQYMEKFYPICNIVDVNLPANKPEEDDFILDNFFENYPGIFCGITFNSKVYSLGEYLQRKNKKNFSLIGYDLLTRNVECLKSGYVTFLIAQQPEIQGFNAIKAFCEHLIFKKEVTCINYMPIDFISKETIDFYLKFQR